MVISRAFAALVGLAFAGTVTAAQAATISTLADQSGHISLWGERDTSTYGQTFIAPSDNILTSFTFFVNDLVDPSPVGFNAYVYAWDSSLNRATGPQLFKSADMVTDPNAIGFEQIAVDVDSVTLTEGQSYVAFFSTIEVNNADPFVGHALWASAPGDSYGDGAFVFQNTVNLPAQWVGQSWGVYEHVDSSFEMTFTTVIPIPAALPLFATALAGMGLIGWRRRRSVQD